MKESASYEYQENFKICGCVGTISNRDGNWLLWHFLTTGVAIKF
jgi:hypothetical protein